MDLPDGLYEQIINSIISKELNNFPKETVSVKKIDSAESKTVLSKYVSEIVEKVLLAIKEKGLEWQVALCNDIIQCISNKLNDDQILKYKIEDKSEQLSSVNTKGTIKKENRPESSLAMSSLFTGSKVDPLMVNELKKEILTSDRVDIIVSFIRCSGLRLIYGELKEFTKRGKLRVLTTTYMGATESKAISKIAALPNTEVKIAYDVGNTRLHAKSYIFHRDSEFNTAYVGSSNLSNVAITEGKEWNVKITSKDLTYVFANITATFETYWNTTDFVKFEKGDEGKLSDALNKEKNGGKAPEIKYVIDAVPYSFQKEILDKLDAERKIHGRFRNLVVAATGTGKTVISAFDYKRFCEENPGKKNTLLFVAHREEILKQSLATFRGILKDGNFGELYTGNYTPGNTDHLFMSVQTFKSKDFQNTVSADYYDFIIVDETHHSAAPSYHKIFTYFNPKILLGLTATPERMDGIDITDYFDNRIAAEIRLGEAVDRGFLVPFQYFCISDVVDLSGMKFEKGKYDQKELNDVYVGNVKRANLILSTIDRYSPNLNDIKALGFCVTKEHAFFMADTFNANGFPSIALTADSSREERETAQSRLKKGDVKVIFTVDLYNEGVDIPQVNTVLFLRPTESTTVFIQQLGRGLRTYMGKTELTVFDFIAQAHKKYSYEKKFSALTSVSALSLESQVINGFSNLPTGCYIQMDRVSREYILNNIKTNKTNRARIIDMAKDYEYETGEKITLSGFLGYASLSPQELYSMFTFTKLCELAGLMSTMTTEEDDKFFRNGLLSMTNMNSRRWMSLIRETLNSEKGQLTPVKRKAVLMLFYSFYRNGLQEEGYGDLQEFISRIKSHPLRKELFDVLNYMQNKIDFIDKEVDLGYDNLLDLHCTYTRNQILAGIGKSDEKLYPSREGVLYDREKDTDIFFVTIRKSEKEFSPTTMYEDYALSDKLFHWQSQSGTAPNSPTGMRYISQRKTKHNTLLFVRESNTLNSRAPPYVYLGKVNFVNTEGSRPMSIVWELEEPMPPWVLEMAKIVK